MTSTGYHSRAWLTCTLVLACGLCAAARAVDFAGGTGTPDDPYQIATAEQLRAVGSDAQLWDGHFRLVADIELAGGEEMDHPLIGYWRSKDDNRPFRGTFDGAGHVIADFSHTSLDRDNVGLFGYVADANAVIKDLEMINPHVYAPGGENVGVLVGRLERGAVSRCGVSRGVVLAEGGSYVGLLAGRVQSGTLQDCYAAAGLISGGTNVGGLAGGVEQGTVVNCWTDGIARGDENAGGLVGILAGLVARCYATGILTGGSTVGGLVGRSEPRSRIENCYSTADVTGQTTVGGLVGYHGGTVVKGYAAGGVSGTERVGGLIGQSDGAGGAIEAFWDIETCGQQQSAAGTGKITAEMMTMDTFLTWGACGSEAVWTLEEGKDYPRLLWEGQPGEVIALAPLAGTGTEDDPYLVQTAAELNEIGLMTCIWDKHFRLLADIDLSGYRGTQFRVIGNEDIPFAGVFDGAGHTIASFQYAGQDAYNVGLFGCVRGAGAEIRDLELIDPNVDAGAALYAGALVGRLAEGTISRCGVTRGHIHGRGYVGGLVGRNDATVIESCADAVVAGDTTVGGLVGSNHGGLSDCYATGVATGWSGVGGLAGGNLGTVAYSYATAAVTSSSYSGGSSGMARGGVSISSDQSFGGLIGWRDGEADVFCSFWDTEASGQQISAGGTPRTAAQMRMADTFLAWGACGREGAWTLDEGQDYPRLRWQNRPGEPLRPVPLAALLKGTGTPENPCLIHTPDELNLIGLFPCAWDKHFRLMADIDLLAGTEPQLNLIGTVDWPFTGVFDGNGHSLMHLTHRGSDTLDVGLFRHVADHRAAIKNLGLIDPNISVENGVNVGALVGWLEDGSVTNCYVTGGTVRGSTTVGGLVGRVDAGVVRDCHVTTAVSGGEVGGLVGYNADGELIGCRCTGTITGGSLVGGLAGSSHGIILHCCATGRISIPGYGGTAGGLVGDNYGRILCSYAACDIAVFEGSELGGLVGCSEGTGLLANCYAVAKISCQWPRSWLRQGGLVGENTGGPLINCYAVGELSTQGSAGHIDGLVGYGSANTINCFWGVDISRGTLARQRSGLSDAKMASFQTYRAGGWDFVGERANGTADPWDMPADGGCPTLVFFSDTSRWHALAGAGTAERPYRIAAPEDLGAVLHYDGSACFKLTADIDLSGIRWTMAPIPHFGGHLDGAGFVISHLTIADASWSGLFGVLDKDASVTNLGIEDANIALTDAGRYVGILAGRNRGSVSSCYTTGDLHTADWASSVGGLVGWNDRGTIARCYSSAGASGWLASTGGLVGTNAGQLVHSYATGALSSEYASGCGGLVGENDGGSVVGSFWDVQASGAKRSAGGMGATTAQMAGAEFYSLNGWAGDPNWVLDNGKDYPRLAWEGKPGQPIPAPVIDWLSGSGTAEDPYVVTTGEQLARLARASVLWDKVFVLASDLDLRGMEFLPIGVAPGSDFSGSFDGAGHVLHNLSIDATTTSASYLGLFGCIGPAGRVSRLGLGDAVLEGGDNSDYLGTLAGFSRGTITYCYAAGSITGGVNSTHVGGLVGVSAQGAIADCYAAIKVSGGREIIGGVVGLNQGGCLTRCYGASSIVSGYQGTSRGGLAGTDESGSITDCYFLESYTYSGGRGKGIAHAAPDNGLGVGLTDTQMKQQTSFADWDFIGVWSICEDQGYPRLRWEGVECEPQ